jgi:hypothetical protein
VRTRQDARTAWSGRVSSGWGDGLIDGSRLDVAIGLAIGLELRVRALFAVVPVVWTGSGKNKLHGLVFGFAFRPMPSSWLSGPSTDGTNDLAPRDSDPRRAAPSHLRGNHARF